MTRPTLAVLVISPTLVWAGVVGPWNQPPPYAVDGLLSRARPYAEDVLTTVNGLTFESDGRTLYVSRWVDDEDRDRRRPRIFRHRFVAGAWLPAEPMAFSHEFTDYQPVLSPDGSRLFFTSTRPLPGTRTEVRQNIWYVDRAGDEWGAPRIVAELVSPGWDGYAVSTARGRLYFVSERAGGLGAVDIWSAEPLPDGRYSVPRNVTALNSEHSDSDLFVDPYERYVVFHRFVEATDDVDLWIAFGAAGEWRAPRPLDEVNGPGWELSPTVSPDGRYFFFHTDGVIQQVDFCALVRVEERRFLSASNGPSSRLTPACGPADDGR